MTGNNLTVFRASNGWWARLSRPGWFMDRGPYPFQWMAKLAFPIQRWTWKGGAQ